MSKKYSIPWIKDYFTGAWKGIPYKLQEEDKKQRFKVYALELIKEGEGFVDVVYGDVTGKPLNNTAEGIPTIGYGTNLTLPLDEDVCSLMLEKRMEQTIKDLSSLDFYKLDYKRRAVLIDMAYNLGISGLLEFNHLMDAVHEQNWKEAADGIYYSKYFKQVGNRAKRNLLIMLTGKKWNKAQAGKDFKQLYP